jgi:hypothetical protein
MALWCLSDIYQVWIHLEGHSDLNGIECIWSTHESIFSCKNDIIGITDGDLWRVKEMEVTVINFTPLLTASPESPNQLGVTLH